MLAERTETRICIPLFLPLTPRRRSAVCGLLGDTTPNSIKDNISREWKQIKPLVPLCILRVTFSDLTEGPAGLIGVTSIARRQRFLPPSPTPLLTSDRGARVSRSEARRGAAAAHRLRIGLQTRLSPWHFHDPCSASLPLRRSLGEVFLTSPTRTGFNLLRLLSDFYLTVNSLVTDNMQVAVNYTY